MRRLEDIGVRLREILMDALRTYKDYSGVVGWEPATDKHPAEVYTQDATYQYDPREYWWFKA
jgi:hypothetical protein